MKFVTKNMIRVALLCTLIYAPASSCRAEDTVATLIKFSQYMSGYTCIEGSSSYHPIGSTGVECGCDYPSYAISSDGKNVCVGGKYSSYAISSDGKNVCVGGKYSSSAISSDGKSVSCGPNYSSYATSSDGKEVCCGGMYFGAAGNFTGSKQCRGGWADAIRKGNPPGNLDNATIRKHVRDAYNFLESDNKEAAKKVLLDLLIKL
jgi:hypothetical protein